MIASPLVVLAAAAIPSALCFDGISISHPKNTSAAEWIRLVYRLTADVRRSRSWLVWTRLRAKAVAPVFNIIVIICMVMSVMMVVEVVYMATVSLVVMLLRRRPEKRYKWEPIGGDTEEGSSCAYPMVLVQIPLYNEKEVYKLSIEAACGLTWPTDRIIVQILDDSTDPIVKDLVALECKVWAKKGRNIAYEVRNNRKGYKAGALMKGMEHSYVQQCEFIAIFDADFQPDSDFLIKTIPFLVSNSKIALVQARWEFVNYKDCLMTRIQKLSLDYHFKVEQEAGSSTFSFFGFNGTAGVWRTSAIIEAGGWKDRTTVEDMDLAVRASLKGWDLLYVGDVKVRSELPSNFRAYRHQQHRWTCGPASLLKKTAVEIMRSKAISIWKKIHMIYSFFFVRKITSPIVTFVLYCLVIPASVLVPEVRIPVWGVLHIPTTISVLFAIRNPSSIHIMPFWILFENVMSMHRMKSTLSGLFETSSVNEWVVTEKFGDALKLKPETGVPELTHFKNKCRWIILGFAKGNTCYLNLRSPSTGKSVRITGRIPGWLNFTELGFAVFLICCAAYDVAFGNDRYYIYIFLQASAFIIMGFGFVGTSPYRS